MTNYDRRFYDAQRQGSYQSARMVLGLLCQHLQFRSACDVGCGAGTWVRALQELGIADVTGVDGDYARRALMIDERFFAAADLREPLALGRGYDLALSLEVAEHLPPSRGSGFVADLVRLAPAVLFSAAIPFQSGTDHVNERWQDAWVDEFSRHGYLPFDILRPRIWKDRTVEVWYRQNILLFASADHPQRASLESALEGVRMPLSVVHPDMFPLGMNADNRFMILKMLFWSFARSARRISVGRRKGANPARSRPAG